jgi:TatA/E family protein of Tat protein translocase
MPSGLTSPAHLFVIILVGLVVLGPEKLPQTMRQMGKGLAEFRRWSDSLRIDMQQVPSVDDDADDVPAPPNAWVHRALREGGEWNDPR